MVFDKNKQYPLFISHCWDYNKEYYTVEKWINKSNIEWRNMSIPIHNPKNTNTNNELKIKIENNIKESSIFLIIAGMYAAQNNRKWINFELHTAKNYDKKILAIQPWGNERMPKEIQEVATDIVEWQNSSIINGIKNLL